MESRERFIDQLLDSAFVHQQRAEPRTGLEARILERVRTAESEGSGRKKLWKVWVAAAAVTSVVAVIVAIHLRQNSQAPAVEPPQATYAVPERAHYKEATANPKATLRHNEASPVLEAKRAARKTRKPTRKVQAHHWPSQFPTPAPLTKEQKALVQYVRNTPPQVLAEPVLKEATIRPIEIEPLKIPPIIIKPLASRSTMEETE